MRTSVRENRSASHSPRHFFNEGRQETFFRPSLFPARSDIPAAGSADTRGLRRPGGTGEVVQRQTLPSGSQPVAGMSSEEKWLIVYDAALEGAGNGLMMALIFLLGALLIIALGAAVLAFICSECLAAIVAFFEITVAGVSIGTWLAAGLGSLGATMAVNALVRELQTVYRAVPDAQTVADLQIAGRNWGYRSARALGDLFLSFLGAVPGMRPFLRRLASRLPGRRSLPPGANNVPPGRNSSLPGGTSRPAPSSSPPAPASTPVTPVPAPATPVPTTPTHAPTAPVPAAPATAAPVPIASGSLLSSITLLSRRVLRYGDRDIVAVQTALGPQGFYRRTGLGRGRPAGHGGAQAGDWAPFDGIHAGILKKDRFTVGMDARGPLYGYGNDEFRAAGRWLDRQHIAEGEDVGELFSIVNTFLESMGCPVR